MAHIAAGLMEDAFGDKKVHLDLTRKPNAYHINLDRLDAMLFAVYNVQQRVQKLRDKYLDGMQSA